MYLNAIKVMSILAVQDQRKTWEAFYWTLPEYNVCIFLIPSAASGTPSGLQTRFAVWCLDYVMNSISISRRYNPLIAELCWQDVKVGEVSIERTPQPTSSIAATSLPQRNVRFGNSSSLLNATKDLNSLSDLGESFVVFFYNGVTLNSVGTFLSVLAVMKTSANEGADSRCPGLTVDGPETVSFQIRSEKDQYGNPLLRYRHVIRLVRKVAFKMVSNHKFAEMFIVLELNGVKAAEAKFTKIRVPHADASDGIQITR